MAGMTQLIGVCVLRFDRGTVSRQSESESEEHFHKALEVRDAVSSVAMGYLPRLP
jgi:hypothetical protein